MMEYSEKDHGIFDVAPDLEIEVDAPQDVSGTRPDGHAALPGADEAPPEATDSDASLSAVEHDMAADTPEATVEDALQRQCEETRDELASLRAAVESCNEAVRGFGSITAQMQERIEELQRDQLKLLLKPLYERVATVIAQAEALAITSAAVDEGIAEDFTHFSRELEAVLEMYDVESVGAAPGAPFDPRLHHAALRVDTADPTLDRTIQKVVRQGWTAVGSPRVLLPARVVVRRYVPTSDESDREAAESVEAVSAQPDDLDQ